MNQNDNDIEHETPFLAPESMEFVHCPECYGEIAKHSPTCPHCGAVANSDGKPKNQTIYILWVFLIGLGAVTILAGLLLDFAGPGMIIGGFLLLAASLIKRFV